MCGIAGVVNYNDIDLKKLEQALLHRGPDAQSIYIDNQVALIHTRLAIQDVQHGAQPFHFGNYSIIFNGEIYNHQILRRELKEFNFQTNSDTETLLYLFIKFHFKMFAMIDGMFAFCIYDKAKQQIILARDRAGKKPLYFYQDEQSFIFSSEINAIKSIKNLNINHEAINCYLHLGMIWRPFTAYSDIFELEAATYLILNLHTLQHQTEMYFDILDYYHRRDFKHINLPESINLLETKLQKSVADRINASDVEVGVFLSGGIDSNLIAAFAANLKPKIKTFTVKFPGLYDESSLAKLTAVKYNTEHIELNISENLHHDIEKILIAYGEPFMDSSAIPSYYVSQAAARNVKVILSGDGADELFAGYRRYLPIRYSWMKYIKFMAPLFRFLPKPHNKLSKYNYIYRLIGLAHKKNLDFYLSATMDIFQDVLPIKETLMSKNLNIFIQKIFNDNSLTPLSKMLACDFNIILFCDLLVKMDIASMANSLEVRSPFLSQALLEFVPGLPDKFKIHKFKTKYILRKLAENYLPSELIHQPKRGFEVPLKQWVNNDLHDTIHDHLVTNCYSENFISRDFIQRLLKNKIDISAEKRAKMLWSLYCLEVWYKYGKQNFSHC